MNSDIKQHLGDTSKEHDASKVQGADQRPPDDTYVLKVKEAGFKVNNNQDNFMFIMKFEVVGGDYDGWKVSKVYSKLRVYSEIDGWITDHDRFDRLAQDFQLLNCPVESWENIDQSFEDGLNDTLVMSELVSSDYNNRVFQFVNFLEVVDENSELSSSDTETTPAQDDVPF